MIRIFSSIFDRKVELSGAASGGYLIAPDAAKPEIVESLKEVAFLGTSLSWAAFFEVAAGVYILILIGSWLHGRVKSFRGRGGRKS